MWVLGMTPLERINLLEREIDKEKDVNKRIELRQKKIELMLQCLKDGTL